MTKKTSTTIAVNRLDTALTDMGVRLKRMQLLQGIAAAFGYRNTHELAAADTRGEVRPPEARYMGRTRVPRIGMMLFLQDPDGTVFAVDEDRFDAQTGQAGDWILSPLGGLLDVSALRSPQAAASADAPAIPERTAPLDKTQCGASSDDAMNHLAIRSQLNRAIYKAVREYDMGNMCEEGDPSSPYPLVDLMSNPAPSDIGTGEMEMISLVDEIENAVRRTLGLPDEKTDAVQAGGSAPEQAAPSRPRSKLKRQREDRPGRIDPLEPMYMTSGCCESTDHVDHEDLAALGLASGWFDDTFYPLTDAEGRYIAEEYVQAADGLHAALMGYSVLYRSTKWFMPTVEVAFQTDDDLPAEHRPRSQVISETQDYAGRIRGKVEEFGGEVMTEIEEDRVLVKILVPVTKAMDVGDYDAWKEMLAWLLVDPALPTVQRNEVQHVGKRFRVSASWIGEGQDGDYDADEPHDHPLLRLDADELVDGKWVEVRDGSYCCQVHAYAEPSIVRALVQMAVETLENGTSTKRDCEQLSWIDGDKVWRWMNDRAGTDAADESFVAHVTYGNPDGGTSIDLRRRADGSVRCEVYVDLDCAAVLDTADGIAAVRTWLKTLGSDVGGEDRRSRPAVALAPAWILDSGTLVWMLVSDEENEAEWIGTLPDAAPRNLEFVRIDAMDV